MRLGWDHGCFDTKDIWNENVLLFPPWIYSKISPFFSLCEHGFLHRPLVPNGTRANGKCLNPNLSLMLRFLDSFMVWRLQQRVK